MRHDETRIYQRSLELISIAKKVMDDLPTGYGFLADQLRRASSSIVLNFSEGYPKASIKEQRRSFSMAKASCYEVAAILDVAERFGVIHAELHHGGKDIADHVAAMLTKFR